MQASSPATSAAPPRGGRTVWWILGSASVVLWLSSFWVWEVDAWSAEWVLQNLKASNPSLGHSVLFSFRWIVVGAFVVGGVILWRTRSPAVLGGLAFGLPVTLIVIWYTTHELPARQAVMRMINYQKTLQRAGVA